MNDLLLDENISLILGEIIEEREPTIRVFSVGDSIAPPHGTPDPQLLEWIEEHDCLLVTNNRTTMPVHLKAHLEQGRHVSGIVQIPKRINFSLIADELILMLGASLPDEYRDRIVYLHP